MKRPVVFLSIALLLAGAAAMMDDPAEADSESDPVPPGDGEPLPLEEALPEANLESDAELIPRAPDGMRRYSDVNVHPEAASRFPMLLAEPNPSIDYKIVEAVPDPGVSYRMPVVDPVQPRVGDGNWNRIVEEFRRLREKLESDDPQR